MRGRGLASAILLGLFTALWMTVTPALFSHAVGSGIGAALSGPEFHARYAAEAQRYSLWTMLSLAGFPALAVITAIVFRRRGAAAVFGVLLVLVIVGLVAYAYAHPATGWPSSMGSGDRYET